MPHLATTYAAINALITVGGHKSLSSIHRCSIHFILRPLHRILGQLFTFKLFLGCRENLYAFLLRMKDASGGFRFCTIFLPSYLIVVHLIGATLLWSLGVLLRNIICIEMPLLIVSRLVCVYAFKNQSL